MAYEVTDKLLYNIITSFFRNKR